MELGAILWFFAIVGGTALLGIGYALGIAQWRHRDRRLDALTDEATRQNYAAADREANQSDGKGDLSAGANVTGKSNAA